MIFFLAAVPAVYGDLGIAPQVKELKIYRGGRSSFYLTITNHGSESASLVMHADDMDISESGLPFKAEDGYERGCADWVTFIPEEFTLEEKKSQNVHVIVKAPSDVVGSYFAILSCRFTTRQMLDIPTEQKGVKGLEFSMRVGSLLLATVSSRKNTVILHPDSVILDPGSVTRINPLDEVGESGLGQWKVEVPVANDGNMYTIVMGEVSIWTESGRLVARAPLVAGRGFVFPNRRRVFTATGDRPLTDGVYLVRANIRSREGRTRSGSFPFSVANGVAIHGSESEELQSLLRASLPGFSLRKQYINVDIQPGSHRTKGIQIESHSEDTLEITARLMDWNVDKEGNIIILDSAGSIHARSCTSWISVSPSPVVLPPGRKKNVKVFVRAPAEVDGEYYAAVIFDPEGTKKHLPSEFQINRALFITASDKRSVKSSGTIKSIITRQASRKGCVFEIEFENISNVHCYASGSLNLLNQKGERMSDPIAFGGEGEFILPDGVRTFLVPWQGNLESGKYRAEVSITFDENSPSLNETTKFEIK